jgi:hypothetical protein
MAGGDDGARGAGGASEMSETVQGALIAGIAGLTGILVTHVANLLLEKRRELASYRLNLYDKRLAVHQQAFEWIHKLNVELNYAKPGQVDADETKQLVTTTRAARDWWNANALYLDPESNSQLVYFFNLCFEWARGGTKASEVFRQLTVAEKAVLKGIGMKHLDTERERQVSEQ